MTLNSHTEWDRLREVILGTVDRMTVGLEFDPDRPVTEDRLARAAAVARRAVPDWYRDEVAEDLEGLAAILRTFGATVLRPAPYDSAALHATPDWSATGKDLYNARDLHLVVGRAVLACPSPARCRQREPEAFGPVWERYAAGGGLDRIAAPRPRLAGDYRIAYTLNGADGVAVERELHRRLSGGRWETFHRLTEDEPLFDAANVVRLGRDLLYLVSSTGNRRGAAWLQETLGAEYRVHTTDVYRASHIDSTIVPLRPGLVLCNGVRVRPQTLHPVFRGWDALYVSDVAPLPEDELAFQTEVKDRVHAELLALGARSDLDHLCSPWLGLNVLSLDARTVVVHDRQTALIAELERRGLTVVPVRMRHCYTMLGGPHCATLDTVRDGALARYTG